MVYVLKCQQNAVISSSYSQYSWETLTMNGVQCWRYSMFVTIGCPMTRFTPAFSNSNSGSYGTVATVHQCWLWVTCDWADQQSSQKSCNELKLNVLHFPSCFVMNSFKPFIFMISESKQHASCERSAHWIHVLCTNTTCDHSCRLCLECYRLESVVESN